MALVNDLTDDIKSVFETKWTVRDGTVIPESETVALKDGAVKVEAAFLYADLAGSSKLAQICPWGTTAKIIRAYLNCCVRIIRNAGGEIRSFDGDRVMGVFMGEFKVNTAVKCARNIDWMVHNVLNEQAVKSFNSVKENNVKIRHCIGIDVGNAVAVRAGLRNNNDLIWIGTPPSLAAKLSDIRDYPYEVYITKECFSKLRNENKFNGKENVWEQSSIQFAGGSRDVYRTKTPQKP